MRSVVNRVAFAAFGSVLLPLCCHAQAVTIGAGYSFPKPIDVAPGQMITVFVRVPGKTAAPDATAQPPLPTTLGGFSVLLRQTFPSDPVAVPIQSVIDSQSCSQLAPVQCDVVSMITVQVPFQLTPNVPRTSVPMNYARLDIGYIENAATSLLLNPVSDRIHVLNSCDVVAAYPLGDCVPVATHADGSLVDPLHPAHAGETLAVALVGLGLASQSVATGAAAPQPGPAVDGVLVAFDARPNQSPGLPAAGLASAATAGLRPGSVGIYDVLLTVPALPAGTPACGNDVQSNLTVNIGRTYSWDGVAICVDPRSAAPAAIPRVPRSKM